MIPFWISDEEKVIRLKYEIEFRLYEVQKFNHCLAPYVDKYGFIKCMKKQDAVFRKIDCLCARYEFLVKKINKRIDANNRKKYDAN